MIFAFKIFVRELLLMAYAKIFGYYKRLDKLPVYNWFELLKGRYQFIYKRPIKSYPAIFGNVYMELFYQFEKIDTTYFEEIHKLAYLRSLYATTGQLRFLNQANFLEAKIEKNNKIEKAELPNLNKMINLIEEEMNSIGSIDKYKMDTARFYSLYHRAVEKINARRKK